MQKKIKRNKEANKLRVIKKQKEIIKEDKKVKKL